MIKTPLPIPSANQFGSGDVSGVKMVQTTLHFAMENQGVPSTPGGNFRCISVYQERNELASKFQRLPTFSAMADSMELVSTLCDVGRQPEIAMATYTDSINRKQ